jgi:hypothetical protein
MDRDSDRATLLANIVAVIAVLGVIGALYAPLVFRVTG